MNHPAVSASTRSDVDTAIRWLLTGGVVAIPTDTVYGLAASLDHPKAIERIFRIKGRPAEKALPVLVSDPGQLEQFGIRVPAAAKLLAERFWPGQLTIIVPASSRVPAVVHRGGTTVGLRMPSGTTILEIIRAAGGAVAVTSANRSGLRAARTADEVRDQLGTLVDAIVDGGPSPSDRPSTVVDATVSPIAIVRAGALEVDSVLAYLDDVMT